MELNWQLAEENKYGKYYKADYFAYKALDDRDIKATASVEPSIYFPQRESECQTVIIDTFLRDIGSHNYIIRYAYGREIGDNAFEKAKRVCEGYGVRLTQELMRNIDIERTYKESLKEIACWYIDTNIEPDNYTILSINRQHLEVIAQIEIGGDSSELHIVLSRDMHIDSFIS